jgi:hypothetical protein
MVDITHDWDDEDYEKSLDEAYDEYRKACYGDGPIPQAQYDETKQAFLSGIHWVTNRDSYCPDELARALRSILHRKNPHIKLASLVVALVLVLAATGCMQESQVASSNMSIASKNFELNRRCVFYNGITGDYILTIEGLLSVTDTNNKLEVMVKTGPASYKKHYLGLSDNVTYFVEQIESVSANPFHYRVVFRPQTIIPDITVQTR